MIKMDLETKIALTIELFSVIMMLILINWMAREHRTTAVLFGCCCLVIQLAIIASNLTITPIDENEEDDHESR